MQPPFLSTPCSCEEGGSGQGYSTALRMCMKGISTSCDVCPHQKKCAKIRTVVGDGIRAFGGDCRITSSGARSQCEAGAESSLAFPGSIARDDQDNLYIADFGNNRVRKWDKHTNTVVTIAGTGELGFSGDGGPARSARLRQPEGIAVKPGVPAHRMEIFFSDFLNERIRRLTLRSGVWYIDTVAGTGTKGDAGARCDNGCNATTEAIMNNPRALAFSSAGDLFIADSGNRKIRKLTPNGVFSTLVGSNTPLAPIADSLVAPSKDLLAGHWSQPSKSVSIGTLYYLTIDNSDNLWYADGLLPRIWKTSLYSRTEVRPAGSIGRLLQFYLSSFVKGHQEKERVQGQAASALVAWSVWGLNLTRPEIMTTTEQVGFTKWMYGGAETGNWCDASSRESCKPSPAQNVKLMGVLGLCFDTADNMYISDGDASEIIYLDKEGVNSLASRTLLLDQRKTTRNCKCLKYWFDIRNVEGVDQSILLSSNPASICKQNPQLGLFLAELPPQKARSIVIPDCTTTNYCALGPQGVDRCYIERTTPGDVCYADQGYCSKPGLVVSWKSIPNVAILGNEQKSHRFSVASQQEVVNLTRYLTEDLWIQMEAGSGDGGLLPLGVGWSQANTTMLVGFVADNNPPRGCSSHCCGLRTLTGVQIPGEAQQDSYLNSRFGAGLLARLGGSISRLLSQNIFCALDSFADIQTLQAYFSITRRYMILVWQTADSLQMSQGSTGQTAAAVTREDCEERCMLDDGCHSYMVSYNESSGEPADTGICIGFSKNDPFWIYTFDRAGLANSRLATLTRAQQATYQNQYKGPTSPYSRLFNADSSDGVWVSGDGTHMKDLLPNGGPHLDYALNIKECKDLCTRTADCYTIVYPGCYLLNRTNIPTQNRNYVTAGGKKLAKTMVYVKKDMDRKVEGVAGYPEVYTFKGENDAYVRDAYLNKPGPCVVDSKGDLIFTDIWNQRIRKVNGYSLDCVFAVDSGRKAFIAATEEATRNCTGSARMTQLYERIQQEVVQHRSLVTLEREFCNYVPPVNVGVLPTNNTFILCEVCEQLWGPNDPTRPAICPWQELCDCTRATMEVVKTEVFKLCRLRNAYHDAWHRWATGFLHCLVTSEADTIFLSNSTYRQQLSNSLLAYAR